MRSCHLLSLLSIVFTACESNTNTTQADSLLEPPRPILNYSDSSPSDMILDQDEGVRLIPIDARIQDAFVVDAETIVCEYYSRRRPCVIDGFLGPCAQGEQPCNITYWGQCSQINFPRMEVCDGVDNDCDGTTDED